MDVGRNRLGLQSLIDLYGPLGRIHDHPAVGALSNVLLEFFPNLFFERIIQEVAELT